MDEFGERERESFAIQSAIVINELQYMLEKVKKIEAQLIQEGSPQVMTTDFYRPSPDSQCEEPLRKKMKK